MRTKEEVGLDVFNRICECWGLSDEEREKLLKKAPEGDQLIQISYVLGIYKALHILYEEPERADAWIRRPNRAFEGRPALDVMLDDPDGSQRVRRYLDFYAY